MSSDSDISLSEQSEVDSEVNFQQNYVLESEDINSLVAEDLEHLHGRCLPFIPAIFR